MITINLLPKKEKIEFKYDQLRSFAFRRIVVLTVLGILVGGVLIVTEYIMKKNLISLQRQIDNRVQELNTAETQKLQNTIDLFNQKLKTVSQIQKNHAHLNPLLNELILWIPINIKLDSILLSKQENTIEISGKSETRDSLLQFQQKIENSDYFTNVQSPLSNLSSKKDVEFNLKFEIAQEFLKDL